MAYGYWKRAVGRSRGGLPPLLPQEPVRGRLHRGLRPGRRRSTTSPASASTPDDLAYLATLARQRRPAALRARRSSTTSARLRLDVRRRRHARGHGRLPARAAAARAGPHPPVQLLETPLLNIINFQTLIATKAARVCLAAQGEPVLEFGLRRAQGIDGGLSAAPGGLRRRLRRRPRTSWPAGSSASRSRAPTPTAGSCASTTSWRPSRPTPGRMPNNCVFLVDTYDTLRGRAPRGRGRAVALRAAGTSWSASGSTRATWPGSASRPGGSSTRPGFRRRAIVASQRPRRAHHREPQGAGGAHRRLGRGHAAGHRPRPAGPGRRLQARGRARRPGRPWQHQVKLSEQAVKTSTPGILQVRRYCRRRRASSADVIYDEETGLPRPADRSSIRST